MGVLVPVPMPASATRSVPMSVETVAVLPRWLCLYCHTVQAGNREDCCNCGAPREGMQAAARWVADTLARRQGLAR